MKTKVSSSIFCKIDYLQIMSNQKDKATIATLQFVHALLSATHHRFRSIVSGQTSGMMCVNLSDLDLIALYNSSFLILKFK